MGFFDEVLPAAINARRGTPDYTGVQLHTSAQAIPIPIMWGTRRIAPNIIWNSTVIDNGSGPVEIGHSTGPDVGGQGFTDKGVWQGKLLITSGVYANTGYGNEDVNQSDSIWWTPVIFALCEGPINSINRQWNGGGAAAFAFGGSVAYAQSSVPPSLFYTVFLGTSGQTAWGYFAFANALSGGPYYTGQDLTYRLTAYIASAVVDTGHDRRIPQQSFEVIRTPITGDAVTDSLGIGKDYPASDIVSDFLTNTQYGMGFTSSDIDSASLLTYLQYCMGQGLVFSPLLTSQIAGTDFVDRLAVVSNTWAFYDGLVFRFVPLGDETVTGNGFTFTPDLSPAYNLTYNDFLDLPQVDRADPIDCYNRVRLEFCDRGNDYSKNPVEWKDTTLINQFGIRDASNIDGQDICDIAVAAKVVELFGKRMAYLRNTYTYSTSYRFIRCLPGTVVTLSDPTLGLVNQLVRIRSVEEVDDGKLQFVAEELPGTLGLSRPMPTQTWNPTVGAAGGSPGAAPIGGAGSNPTSTSGGVLVMDSTMTLVLFVAGDVITLPPVMATGKIYGFMHDQQRSPQPTQPLLEANPVKIQRPGGATYNILDIYDPSLAPATSITIDKRSGLTFTLVATGDGLIRPV